VEKGSFTLKNRSFTGHSKGNPYEDLYIYYLENIPEGEEEALLGPHFLGNWVEDGSSFLFFSRPSRDYIQRLIDNNKKLKFYDEFYFTYEQWQGGEIEPIRICDFYIIPPWLEAPEIKGKIKMILDPGVVFGNALHPTTRDSLIALCEIFKKRSFSTVIDIGTGTGVLAIGAGLLGAGKVLAIDINLLAVNTALKNVRLNALEGIVEVREDRAESFVEYQNELLIANIHYDIILELIKIGVFKTKKLFILSGLMRSQAMDIKSELSKYPTEIIREWDNDGIWHTILGRVREK
jgi:ribosomal protein L11 methyltransferase